MEHPAGGKRGEGGRRTTPRGKGGTTDPKEARGTQEIEGGKKYRNEEEKTKQKKKGRNTCLKGRMGDHVSSGEGRRLEEEVRRKQKNCTYLPERGRNL